MSEIPMKEPLPQLTQQQIDEVLPQGRKVPPDLTTLDLDLYRAVAYIYWRKERAVGTEKPTIDGRPGWMSTMNVDETDSMLKAVQFIDSQRK